MHDAGRVDARRTPVTDQIMRVQVGGFGGFLRDVDPAGLVNRPRSEQRAMNKLFDTGHYQVVELPLNRLVGTQAWVNNDFRAVTRRYDVGKPTDLPAVFKVGQKYYVRDGHHRLAAAASCGTTVARVRLYDVDDALGHPPVEHAAPLFDGNHFPIKPASEALNASFL